MHTYVHSNQGGKGRVGNGNRIQNLVQRGGLLVVVVVGYRYNKYIGI